MKIFCGVLLFIGVFTLINTSSPTNLKRIASDQLIMAQLMESRAGNPSYIQPCFDIYIPIYDAILQEYNRAYLECSNVATAQKSDLDLEARGNQSLISAAAQDVCSSMSECSALEKSLPFLDCYSQVGNTNIKTLYVVTNNASDVAANLREKYLIIENNLPRCQNASERASAKSNEEAFTNLNKCLANGPPEVVTTTTVESETTTVESETTTAEPKTTTVEPESTTEEAVEKTTTEEPGGFEERDLSRSAPQLLTLLNRYKKLNRRALN